MGEFKFDRVDAYEREDDIRVGLDDRAFLHGIDRTSRACRIVQDDLDHQMSELYRDRHLLAKATAAWVLERRGRLVEMIEAIDDDFASRMTHHVEVVGHRQVTKELEGGRYVLHVETLPEVGL